MTLIKSISGIRGTIGGNVGDNLTPVDIVRFVSAFASMMQQKHGKKDIRFVLGRDARVSGEMVNHLVVGSLMGMGVSVIDGGLSTTPTVEMAVTEWNADGGIILTASHNPAPWNALKLLNEKGEFIDDKEGKEVLRLADNEDFDYAEYAHLGTYSKVGNFIEKHIEKILELPLVDVEAIRNAHFSVGLDAVNSTGGIAIAPLLEALGIEKFECLYCEPNGLFPHNPEPVPENLTDISKMIRDKSLDIGFVVDPDVDRLAIIMENGEMFGEEYTLVAVADYILQNTKGNTVSNMSSTRALKDITGKYGASYQASAVGEVNVVKLMRETKAIIGGEGNGGVIYPELHAGRDALVGIALILSYLAKRKIKVSSLRAELPEYVISKNKIQLNPAMNVDQILTNIRADFSGYPVSTIDGVKIEFETGWVHLRKSNTEPIIRIYAEGRDENEANTFAAMVIDKIERMMLN
jgi:phosphomannomutase